MQIELTPSQLVQRYKDVRARIVGAAINPPVRRPVFRRPPTPILPTPVPPSLAVNVLDEAIKRAMEHPLPGARDILMVASPNAEIERRRLTAAKIILTIAKANNLEPEDIASPRRQRILVDPRQIAMFCAWALIPSWSLPRIGAAFGGRDHTTVLHAVRKMCGKLGVDYAAGRLAGVPDARRIMTEAGYVFNDSAAMCADNAGRGY